MKTLFAKYNNERLPKYQIVTKIVEDPDGKRYALKAPLCDAAKEHINDIYHNYALLKETYDINLVQPQRHNDGILFQMADGESLEKLILQGLNSGNNELVKRYIEQFIAFVDGFVVQRQSVFAPSEAFKTIFGEWTVNEPQDILKVADIDFLFGNLFVDKDTFIHIDYEWVFNFEIPKSYVVWRALFFLTKYHKVDLSKFNIEAYNKHTQHFLENDKNFGAYVHGKENQYFLNKRVLKSNDAVALSSIAFKRREDEKLQNYFKHHFLKTYIRHVIKSLLKFEIQVLNPAIPLQFKNIFKAKDYLKANPDVQESINSGEFKDAWTHFCLHGFEEIRNGQRQLTDKLPFFNESEYYESRPDLRKLVEQGSYEQPVYHHYLLHGHIELLKQPLKK